MNIASIIIIQEYDIIILSSFSPPSVSYFYSCYTIVLQSVSRLCVFKGNCATACMKDTWQLTAEVIFIATKLQLVGDCELNFYQYINVSYKTVL